MTDGCAKTGSGSPQGVSATTIMAPLGTSVHHQLPRFEVFCPSLGIFVKLSLAKAMERGWSEQGCVGFADALSSMSPFPFLRRIHSRVASPQGVFPRPFLAWPRVLVFLRLQKAKPQQGCLCKDAAIPTPKITFLIGLIAHFFPTVFIIAFNCFQVDSSKINCYLESLGCLPTQHRAGRPRGPGSLFLLCVS